MLLFDPDNAIGHESTTLLALADRISESVGAQRLVNATGTDEEKIAKTLAKVAVGIATPPWDNDQFTEDQMANQGCEFNIFVPIEDSKSTLVDGWDVNCVGSFGMKVRWYVPAENRVNLNNTYLYFLDCISRLETDLGSWMLNHNVPRLKSLNRAQGPSFPEISVEVAQGLYMFVDYSLPWGDFTNEQ